MYKETTLNDKLEDMRLRESVKLTLKFFTAASIPGFHLNYNLLRFLLLIPAVFLFCRSLTTFSTFNPIIYISYGADLATC